jgi:hypothetical protein
MTIEQRTFAPQPSRRADNPGRSRPSRIWSCFLDFALVLWVARVPFATTAFGLLILGWAPQAQDLFVEFDQAPLWRMFSFLFVLIVVWAMPTHYAARILLDTDGRLVGLVAAEQSSGRAACLENSSKWVPRFLGLFTFIEVLIAIFRSYLNLPNLDQAEVTASVERALIEMALLVVAGAAAYFLYVVIRKRRIPLPAFLEWLSGKLKGFWQLISPGRIPGSADEAARDTGRLILFGIAIIFGAIFWFGADFVGRLFPRAMAVPFILGGWLPILSYLSAVGRQVRAPLILIAYVSLAGLAVVLGDNHSVRRIDANSTAGPSADVSFIGLDEAVKTWMADNGCDPKTAANCPRPIIVAAAGGASRAAFYTATIVGYFMQDAPKHGVDPNQVRKRLFAISGVSGGSVGAVMVTAALAAKVDSNDHPCVQAPVPLWWGDKVNNWRDCFEALTSGDFLTADFFGFAFNDILPFGLWRDRAAVLEDTWAERYQAVVTRADQPATASKCKGLDCPFLTLRPRRDHWIPLLVLNGTSEATGGRIVTTVLAPTYTPAARCPTGNDPSKCSLFTATYHFHDLLDQAVVSDGWFGWVGWVERYLLRRASGNDVRLSTAAHNSARFPLISPPGTVRNNSDQGIVDRIVDGGYFENYGALSAKELALAVHAVQPQLSPLVVVISNDPEDLLDSSDDSSPASDQYAKQLTTQVRKARAHVSNGDFITDISTPIKTIVNDRTAHGILGVDQLHTTLRDAIPGCGVLVKIRVWPQYRKALSMSWWESAPIQRQLHRQTEDGKDKNENRPHLDAVWQALKATSSSCATAKQ